MNRYDYNAPPQRSGPGFLVSMTAADRHRLAARILAQEVAQLRIDLCGGDYSSAAILARHRRDEQFNRIIEFYTNLDNPTDDKDGMADA